MERVILPRSLCPDRNLKPLDILVKLLLPYRIHLACGDEGPIDCLEKYIVNVLVCEFCDKTVHRFYIVYEI